MSTAAVCEGSYLLQQGKSVEVVQVFDGDTLLLASKQRLRLIGINAPEVERQASSRFGAKAAQPFANQSRELLIGLLAEGLVLLHDDEPQDKYGRLLAHPFTPQGKNITSAMLEAGMGFAVVVAPNLRFNACYFAAETHARKAGRGVWSDDFFAPLEVATFAQAKPGGFIFATGEIASVHSSRRAVWVNFDGELTLMIPHRYMPFFYHTSTWPGQVATVRGWVVDRGERTKPWNKRWMMSLTHPAMINFTP